MYFIRHFVEYDDDGFLHRSFITTTNGSHKKYYAFVQEIDEHVCKKDQDRIMELALIQAEDM